jgi:hypothetical protein
LCRYAEEIGTLEERLSEATAAADEVRAACEERDALLQEGASMLEVGLSVFPQCTRHTS